MRCRPIFLPFIFFLLLAVLLAAAARPAAADIALIVNDYADAADLVPGDGLCDSDPDPVIGSCTLRAAIQEANAQGGGSIALIDGTYDLTLVGSNEDAAATGDLDIQPNVTLVISGWSIQIVAKHGDRIFHILDSADLTLWSVWVSGGSGIDGGGIYVASHGKLTMIGGIQASTATRHGGGIYNAGAVALTGTIASNSATTGGGIYNSGTLTVTSSSLSNNRATASGGGIANLGAMTVLTTTLASNSADVNGGGLHTSSGVATIRGSTFQDNTATGDGGGAYVHANGALTMVATTVRDSIAGGQGGGMYNAGALTIESSTVTLGRATAGGGIANVGTLDVMTGTLTGNTASADGGCLHISSGSATVRDCTFWWCTASGAGGGVHVGAAGILNLNSSSIDGSTAGSEGGGIYNDGAATLASDTLTHNQAAAGGGIANLGALTITASDFEDNQSATDGGGLYNPDDSSRLENVTFERNSAIRGGGMYNGTGAPIITSSSFLTNSVTTDAGRGGGLYNEAADLTLEGLTFQDNSAAGYFYSMTDWAAGKGGALYNGTGDLILRNNTFRGNWAEGYHLVDSSNPLQSTGGEGGALYNKAGDLAVEHNIFTANAVSGVLGYDLYHSSYGHSYGGAIRHAAGSLSVRSNVFTDNTSTTQTSASSSGGGAISSIAGTVTIQSNRFEGNIADFYGGAVMAFATSLAVLDNEFVGNSAQRCAGIVASGASGSIENNTFHAAMGGGFCAYDKLIARNNIVRDNPGGVAGIEASGETVVEHNVIENNETGIIIHSGVVLVQDNTIRNNAYRGIGVSNGYFGWFEASTPIIQRNIIEGNGGWGIAVFDDVLFSNKSPRILNNTIRANDGGICNGGTNTLIQGNTIQSNALQDSHCFNWSDPLAGAGIYTADLQSATITSNRIISNTILDGSAGGGIYVSDGGATIENNLVISNTVSCTAGCGGGGVYVAGGTDVAILSNTIMDNAVEAVAEAVGGGVAIRQARTDALTQVVLHNNIVARNQLEGATMAGGGIYASSEGISLNADYNDIWSNGGDGYVGLAPGPHDIAAAPAFLDEINGDYHLALASPCLDAGGFAHRATGDFEGDPRPMGLAPDIGADEVRSLGVIKTGPAVAEPGDTITYTMQIVNLTPGLASGVRLTDTLPAQVALLGSAAHGLTCAHDGSAWDGALTCVTLSADMPPGASHALTLTVQVGEVPNPVEITNLVTVTANAGSLMALDRATTAISWCRVRLNDGPIGSDLQEAIYASTQESDVVKVSGYCAAHDIYLPTLTLQGGWSHNFTARDPAVHVTTLDARRLGRVLWVYDGPVIEGFRIIGGQANDRGAGINIAYGGSPIIRGNVFQGNVVSGSYSAYGGAISNDYGSPTIQGNRFMSNQATATGDESQPGIAEGGAIYTRNGNPAITNNIFYDNIAAANHALGGAIYNDGSGTRILNNTTLRNTAQGIPWPSQPYYSRGNGGGIYSMGDAVIRNNIVVRNIASAELMGQGGGIYLDAYGTPNADYNDVWGNIGADYGGASPGPHDIWADPRLADPAGSDFHLLAGSPCIDAADPANYPPADFEGDARPLGAAPDIGADETIPGLTAPQVTISRSGNGIRLTWQHASANMSYEIWRDSSPYFAPGGATAPPIAAGMPPTPNCGFDGVTVTCTDANALSDVNANPYYVVRALGAGGTHADSNHVGGFGFAIQPGN